MGDDDDDDYYYMQSSLRAAAGVLYNVTGRERCFALPADPNYDGIWDYQWCTELLPQETYFSLSGGTKDMFWHRYSYYFERLYLPVPELS